MSLFDDTLAEVYTLTGRPDLVAETKIALRQATLAAHLSEVFPRDRVEIPLTLTSAQIFQLDIPTYFPNWRSFAYIRPYDLTTGSFSDIIIGPDQFIAPDGIFDEYLIEKVNVAYVAGNNLNIRLSAAYGGLVVGYYQRPVLTPDAAYESWIAREHPAVVILDAAKRVLDIIGYQEAAARLGILLYGPPPGNAANPTGGEYMQLKQANLEGAGR